VPAALAKLSPDERARLSLTLQARGEDRAKAAADCERLGFAAEIAEFFPDLPARIAGAHLVVARAGASTVSELAVIGRPAILVPYPHALDQDQAANAALLAQGGAAIVVRQVDFTPEALAQIWRAALADFAALRKRAEAAQRAGVPDAAERLADLVAHTASPA
jgi:UDP-N-acetylglucosamine--N-acetylmuramyl-(pentapeptide) pyrophosphoryl-undecaprenol N-acetylglucosamine transferase